MSTIDKRSFAKKALERLGAEVAQLRASTPPPPVANRLRIPGGLEKIVRSVDRPSLLVQDNTFPPALLPTWRAVLENARPALERAIPSVGRVEVNISRERRMIGTAWVVAPKVVVTNRHVGQFFARYGANGTFPLRVDPLGKPLQVFVDFRRENDRVESLVFLVAQVLHIEPDDDASPDIAVLRLAEESVDSRRQPPPPLVLGAGEIEDSQLVAALGYPAQDRDELDAAAMQRYFEGVYEVKRLAPGKVEDDKKPLWGFKHDCTTLGGSSGSPLVDLVDGTVVGVHYSGISGQANFAVRASAVAAVLAKAGVSLAVGAGGAGADATVTTGAASTTPKAWESPSPEAAGGIHAAPHFQDRDGYSESFLGLAAPLPHPVTERLVEAARVRDAGGNTGIELRYRHFSVIQHAERRLPWITGVNIDGKRLRRPPRPPSWFRDGRLDLEQQVDNRLYTNSGFSRGHMVRRLDPCWGENDEEIGEANKDTFHFTNACPQEQNGFNDKLWGNLEDYILDEAEADEIRISVLTGPIFKDEDPLIGDVAIPLSFWKVVAWRDKGRLKAVGFVLSQAKFVHVEFAGGLYRTSERSLAAIARDAGISFNEKLLAADVHSGEEASPFPLQSLGDLDRHFSKSAPTG